MPAFALRHVAFCIPLIMGHLPMAAQNSSYHVEFEPQGSRSFSHLVLVNDSNKSIEAYSVLQTCGRYAQFDPNILGQGYQSSRFVPLRGESGVIKPGERRTLRGGWSYRPGDRSCDAQVEAVLFTDGSFEGEDALVRGLKGLGDGEAASVNYWVDRIKSEEPDGSTLGLLLDEIKEHVADDKAEANRYPNRRYRDRPLWEYWEGRLEVDLDIESLFPKDLSAVKPNDLLKRVTNYLEKRKTDIDGNETMQKLNTVFPPISAPREIGDKAPDGSTP